jgi:CubicO group peptidase (beta-lactamase class C family)
VTQRLAGFDAYMAKTLKDWNAPGVGVGIVVNDKLVFAKGYGFRDYEKKLPFTAPTMSPIASNTKLFTAVAAGMLVEEGKLSWDKPVREIRLKDKKAGTEARTKAGEGRVPNTEPSHALADYAGTYQNALTA